MNISPKAMVPYLIWMVLGSALMACLVRLHAPWFVWAIAIGYSLSCGLWAYIQGTESK